MRRETERSRVLVAVRSPRENRISIALVALALALAVLAIIILAPRLARAETAALDGFVPSVVDFGSEPAPAGSYYFPDTTKYPGGSPLGWRLAPANSTVAVGEGFPQVTAKVKCTVKVTGGTVNVSCPGLERELKGRFVGITGLTTWRETVTGATEPVTKLGVLLYLQTLTVAGHMYHSSVSSSPKGHGNEVVVQVEPRGNAEVKDVQVTFVHQDVAKAAPAPKKP